MEDWAFDFYGLRAAHTQSVLNQLRDTDCLHVSPLTWHPRDEPGVGGNFRPTVRRGTTLDPLGQLTLVDGDVSRTRNRTSDLDTRLHELHAEGMLVLADQRESDPQFVADVEGSWKEAGLIWRPTDETFSAVITADRLGLNLVTADSDVRKLARHWQVDAMTVAEFASAVAA